MPYVEILKGLPGCGKSTYAKDKVRNDSNIVRINKDDMRAMVYDNHYTPRNEGNVVRARDALIRTFMARGLNIIVDDTNLNPVHETHIRELVKEHNVVASVKTGDKPWPVYSVAIKFFEIDVEEAVKRDLKRAASVGRDVIEDMYFKFLFHPDKIRFVEGAPEAIICDLDGTLAIFDGRGPYEWMKCESDLVCQEVLDMLQTYKYSFEEGGDKIHILIMSGRDEECREVTEKWLGAKEVPYDALIMRVEGDTRPDDIVKLELFDKYVRDDFNVKFVIDDRKKVKRMWHKLGLFIFDVNQNDLRF